MAIDIRGVAPLLQVFDMPASIHFYCDVIGFEIVSSSGPEPFDWCLLRLGTAELMLNTAYEADQRPPLPDPARMEAMEIRLCTSAARIPTQPTNGCKAKGLSVQKPAIAPYGMKQLYVLDPDGYNLCFQWPEP